VDAKRARDRRTTAGRGALAALTGALVVALALLAGCGSDDESAGGESPATLDGSTEITSPPPTDAKLPPSEVVEVDADDPMNEDPIAEGAVRTRYAYGPITITPGQNNIAFSEEAVPRPTEDGWIVRIAPNLRNGDGSVIPSDEVMLHHGVWLNTSRADPTAPRLPERMFAAGEEKTISDLPPGYGYRYVAEDGLTLNYMLHNLGASEHELYMTYDIDLIPADAPEAAEMVESRPIWMDVQNGEVYPVFDSPLETDDDEYTYPDDASADDSGHAKSRWTVDRHGVLVFGSGHLHAGGASVDLFVERDGEEVQLVNSQAEYFDPNGPVSWDLAMTATPDDWRVAIRQGDVLRISTTYNSDLGAWYESMGIMVLAMADAGTGPDAGVDPFSAEIDLDGEITHDQLPENDNHGGEETDLPDPTDLPDGDPTDAIPIAGFQYADGQLDGALKSVPTVRAGQSILFDNSADAPLGNGLWHTITSCEAPCNASTGISYPLPNGQFQFDSGQLGDDGEPTAGRVTWQTPTDLSSGTYTYFCRIHPSMRGAFRVVE
jgi:plastocyanin